MDSVHQLPTRKIVQLFDKAARECHSLIHLARESRLLTLPQAASIPQAAWCELVRRPTRVRAGVIQAVGKTESFDDLTQTCIEWRLERRQFNEELRERLTHYLENGVSEEERIAQLAEVERCYHEDDVPALRAMLADAEAIPETVGNWFRVPEVNFFLSVTMPCWLEYQTTPHELYRRARRGEFDALECLLRLEPETAGILSIADQRFTIRKQSPQRHLLLEHARLEGRKRPITLADVKFLLGAWLMDHSQQWQRILNGELHIEILKRLTPPEKQPVLCRLIKQVRERARREPIKCRLKSPDIHRLFDAAARDLGEGVCDRDFSQQPNSILKRLKANMVRLNRLAEADKRRAA